LGPFVGRPFVLVLRAVAKNNLNDSVYTKDIWDNNVDKSKFINTVLFKSNEKYIIYLWVNDTGGGNIYWE